MITEAFVAAIRGTRSSKRRIAGLSATILEQVRTSACLAATRQKRQSWPPLSKGVTQVNGIVFLSVSN